MRLKNRLICFLAAFCLIVWAAAGASAQTSPCAPVAEIFGKAICREDIAMEEDHVGAIKQQYESEGLDSEDALKSRSLERLRDTIWAAALEHKFGAERLAPSRRDIDLYGAVFKDTLRKNHDDNKETAQKIKALLDGQDISPEERQELTALLSDIETSIVFYEQREQSQKDMPQEFHDMVAEAENGIAETMIREWKTDKALYEEYGGRLILRQGRPEPIDAYRKFLDYIKTAGNLKILDPAYEAVFDPVKNAAAGQDGTLQEDAGAETYRNYFALPYWAAVPEKPAVEEVR